jgi:hypothetical protein
VVSVGHDQPRAGEDALQVRAGVGERDLAVDLPASERDDDRHVHAATWRSVDIRTVRMLRPL